MKIRCVQPEDRSEWWRMRCASWPEGPASEHQNEIQAWFSCPDSIVFVAEKEDGHLAGFAEVGTRRFADGCDTSPVAYLEGWYVDPEKRGQGIGAALVAAAEAWAKERGLHEFASDALLDNIGSQRAHEALGFVEVERAVRYRKRL